MYMRGFESLLFSSLRQCPAYPMLISRQDGKRGGQVYHNCLLE
jgi:hypothetical protein